MPNSSGGGAGVPVTRHGPAPSRPRRGATRAVTRAASRSALPDVPHLDPDQAVPDHLGGGPARSHPHPGEEPGIELE